MSQLKEWKVNAEQRAESHMERNPSLLHQIVSAIAESSTFDEQIPLGDESLVPYEISQKIEYNWLRENKYVISEYAQYQGQLQALYQELERESSYKKARLLRFVSMTYIQVKAHYLAKEQTRGSSSIDIVRAHSDDIFTAVTECLSSEVVRSLPPTASLTQEEVTYGVLIVAVDAFIACKILETPR